MSKDVERTYNRLVAVAHLLQSGAVQLAEGSASLVVVVVVGIISTRIFASS